ncbi:MAG: hypothetical protein ACP6IU_06750 [Candidatus Asgardarchaeia archaeon]
MATKKVVLFIFLFFFISITTLSFNVTHNYTCYSLAHIYANNEYAPPELITPDNGTVIERGDLVTFKWTNVENVANYTLLIDTATNFSTSNLIKVEGITETEYTLNTSNMAYGEWYWKVIAVYDDGQKASSEILTFYIDPKRENPPGMISILDVLLAMFLGPIPLLVIAIILKRRKGKESK